MKKLTTNEKIFKITEKCLQINNEGRYFAFCNFSGHVNVMGVRITDNPDYENVLYNEDISFNYDEEDSFAYMTSKSVLNDLEKYSKTRRNKNEQA